MKTIALVEPRWGGHHPFYLKIFTKTLIELGYRVLVFCKQPDEVKKYIEKHSLVEDKQLYTFFLQEPKALPYLINQIKRIRRPFFVFQIYRLIVAKQHWRIVSETIQKTVQQVGYAPELVFFTWLDSYLGMWLTPQWVEQVFPYNWSGLYFQPYYLRIRQEEFIRYRFLSPDVALNSKRCEVITVLDEGIAEELQILKGKPVVVFPDLADNSPPDPNYQVVKQIQEQARGRKIIGLLGSLHRQKGLLTILEVSQTVVEEDYFFVFAGVLAEKTFQPNELQKIHKITQQKPDNCFFYFKRIPDEPQFNALVSKCDIILVPYEQFPFSSNLLNKASMFQKPVIATQDFCIGERVENFQIGLTIQAGNVQDCINALHSLSQEQLLNNQAIKSNFEEYQLQHSYHQLKLAFKKVLSITLES